MSQLLYLYNGNIRCGVNSNIEVIYLKHVSKQVTVTLRNRMSSENTSRVDALLNQVFLIRILGNTNNITINNSYCCIEFYFLILWYHAVN